MSPDKPDTDGFLAMIDAKIAALKTLAESYRAAMSLGALGQPGDVEYAANAPGMGGLGPKSAGPVELPQGALLGKSLPAAIHLYLSAVRKKQTVREIVTAMREGGVESTSQNFDNTVNTALHRLKLAGTVLKFNDGWALAEFYPENLRSRLAERDAKPVRKTKRPSKKARGKPSDAGPANGLVGTSMAARILEMLEGFGDDGGTIQDIVDALATYRVTVNRKYVRGILSREYSLGHLDSKRERGRYFAKPKGPKALTAPRAIRLREESGVPEERVG